METGKLILYQSLKAIFLHIDNHEKALLNKYDLSVARFYTLMHIHNNPKINYIDLSDLMLCTKSNTTRIVSSLRKDDLVDRKPHPYDGRVFQLTLTQKGEDLFTHVHPAYVGQINKLMSTFDKKELERYTEVSRQIERKLAPSQAS